MKEEYLQKYLFVKNIETALLLDGKNNHLEFIEYIFDDDIEDEVLIEKKKNGLDKKILVTGNSNEHNLKEIVRAVYGNI